MRCEVKNHSDNRTSNMKITGTRPLHSTPTRSSQRASAKKGADFSSQITEEPAAAVSSSAPFGPVDGILAVQEVPTATDGRSRGIKRGHNLLDHLDEIRLGLLNGSMPRKRLLELGQDIQEARDSAVEPELSSILDDIELRAAVELAKLDRIA